MDRQQSRRPILVGTAVFLLKVHIHTIYYVKCIKVMVIWSNSIFENSLFFIYFLNKDISVNIP